MANETTSTSTAVLYTNRKAKGTYRVYKPKPLKMPRKKKWRYLFGKVKDHQDLANQNHLIKNLKLIKPLDVLLDKSSARKTALLKTYT